MTTSKDKLHLKIIWFVFLVSLLLYLAGMLFPNLRIWGVGQWSHFPWTAYIAALVFAVLAALVVSRRIAKSANDNSEDSNPAGFLYFSVAVFVLLVAAFYLLRGRLHFLGDGYTLLANVALDNPIMKTRNLGEALIHQWVYSMLSGESSARALLSYQLVSYAGGAAFIITVLIAAGKLFAKLRDRVLFALGMLSGGYMLLFFGYAEHYSLFVPSVALFGVIGLLALKGKAGRWLIVPSLAAAIFLHVFGVMLIPAALYLLFVDTGAGRWLKKRSKAVKMVLAGIILAGGVGAFGYLYSTNYFFRFAFVPIWHDRFTLGNYTLFSPGHVVDILNLSLLLLPGLVTVVVMLFFMGGLRIAQQRDMLFLMIFLIPALTAVVVFDPKMGMARDWDLFSFFGIPLTLTMYYFLVKSRASFKQAPVLAAAVIALGFFALIPRVVGQTVEAVGLAQITDYARLDKKKSLILFQQIHEYFWDHGQFERSPLLNFDFDRVFPEYNLNSNAAALREEGKFSEAVVLLKQAIGHNPTYTPAYSNLGSAYVEMGQYDSAISVLNIALGLNPHWLPTMHDLGRAYMLKDNPDRAEEYFKRVLAMDPDNMPAGSQLLQIYVDAGDEEKLVELLKRLARSELAPALVHRQLGEYYRLTGETELANEQLKLAAAKEADSGGTGTLPTEGE